MSTIRQEINLFCKLCGHTTCCPLPFDMKIPHDCERCGANITSPPTEAEMNKRLAAMHDSRILNWTKCEDTLPPNDEPIFLASKGYAGADWMVIRVEAGKVLMYAHKGVWWARDLLGLPFVG